MGPDGALRTWFEQLPDRVRPVVAITAVLATVFALTLSSVVLAPNGSSVAAWWPAAGVSVAALLWMRGRDRWVLGAGLFVVSVVGNMLGDRPFGVSVGFALANLSETVVVTLLLVRAGGARSALASMAGLGRFLQACAAGAAVIAVGAGATVELSGTGDFVDVARAVGANPVAAEASPA